MIVAILHNIVTLPSPEGGRKWKQMKWDFDFSQLSPQNVIETACDLPFARVHVAMMSKNMKQREWCFLYFLRSTWRPCDLNVVFSTFLSTFIKPVLASRHPMIMYLGSRTTKSATSKLDISKRPWLEQDSTHLWSFSLCIENDSWMSRDMSSKSRYLVWMLKLEEWYHNNDPSCHYQMRFCGVGMLLGNQVLDQQVRREYASGRFCRLKIRSGIYSHNIPSGGLEP